MHKFHGILAGKKTYVTAALTVLGAVAAYLLGEATLFETFQAVSTAALGTTIRAGIKKGTGS